MIACAACSSGRSAPPERLAQSASALTTLLVGYAEQQLPRPNPDSADYGSGLAAFQGGALVSAIDFEDYRGRVVAFARSSTESWTSAATLHPPEADDSYCFGFTIAMSGDTAGIAGLATAPMRELVWIYRRAASGQWQLTPEATLEPDAPSNGDEPQFGRPIAIDGDTLLVGAQTEDGTQVDEGSVYVFERQAGGSSWLRTQKLRPSGSAIAGAGFGSAIALHGNRAVVTALGDGGQVRPSLYVFDRPATGTNRAFIESVRIDAPDQATSSFGLSVAFLASTVFVGDTDDNNGTGAVYQVRENAAGGWQVDTRRLNYVGIAGDRFGTSLATSLAQVFVGAPGAVVDGLETGRVEAFDAGGTPLGSLFDRTDRAGYSFGTSLAAGAFGVLATSAGGVHAFVRALGATCTSDIECGSGYCADNVCCNSQCAGACEACSAELKGAGVDGTCGTARAATDPHDSCEASQDPCGQTGLCAADGSCALQSVAVTCAELTCDLSGTISLSSRFCDGLGACIAAIRTECDSGFLCRDGTCLASCIDSADCDQSHGFFCDDSSKCTSGAHCSADRTRAFDASGVATGCGGFFCKDDSCPDHCQSSEDCQQAFACDSVNKACQPLCTATNCDRTQGFYCGESGKCTSGAQCSADRTHAYNASGVAKSCGNFFCKDGSCPDHCEASEDCQKSFVCDQVEKTCQKRCTAADCDRSRGFYCGESGKCTSGAQCSADRTRAYNASGVAKSCGDLFCKDGTCPGHCEASEDCQRSLPCDPVDRICRKPCAAADCDRSQGFYCGETGKCTSGAQCSADRTRAFDASGVAKSCGDTLCKEGVCADHCSGSNDCREPLVCDPFVKTCGPESMLSSHASGDSGCAVTHGFVSGSGCYGAFAGLIGIALRRRSRRRRSERSGDTCHLLGSPNGCSKQVTGQGDYE